MTALRKIEVSTGVFWIEVPDVDARILCGCPADVVKHLMKRGLIAPREKRGVRYESGPNAILLSDVMVQNGAFSNLAEFPVLQMLYRQGMILPGHPGNSGQKPLLMGSADQVLAQMRYIHRGNYGLISEEEMIEAGIGPERAHELMRMKLKFAFGAIREPGELLDTVEIEGVHVAGVLEDLPQLLGELVELRLTHRQTGQLGDVCDVLAAKTRHYPKTFARNSRVARSTSS